MKPRVQIVGGGLAGLSAAAALASLDWEVDLHESRPFLGGRATSYPVSPSDPDSERIDNCQHVLLRCCDNLMDFYRRCGVDSKIDFYDRIHFVRPGGAVDTLERGSLPKPLHLAVSFLRFGFLDWSDKWSLITTLRALEREKDRPDLDAVSMSDWLRARRVTEQSYQRFWRPILVSALNEEPERSSAKAAFQVFADGMLGTRDSYEMGVSAVPLAELYDAAGDGRLGANLRVHLRSRVERIDSESDAADYYVSAVPFERIAALVPGLDLPLEKFEHSPITGVHLWFDRPITELPHAALLDRTMQWMFRRGESYVQCVVSASRELLPMSQAEIVALARRELAEFFPPAADAQLVRSQVIKEVRATYSIIPGLEQDRPGPVTKFPNLFLAGDWTATGWPATMEGAVRSGYLAAEAAVRAAGLDARFLID